MKKNSFKYWFAHWCAYQMVALKHNCWKFRFLFHDWYKPWLGLFWDYEKVREFHRKRAKHHPEWSFQYKRGSWLKLDFIGMIVDWEASQYTKEKVDANLGAWWVLENIYPQLKSKIKPLLKKYKFVTPEVFYIKQKPLVLSCSRKLHPYESKEKVLENMSISIGEKIFKEELYKIEEFEDLSVHLPGIKDLRMTVQVLKI